MLLLIFMKFFDKLVEIEQVKDMCIIYIHMNWDVDGVHI